nr:hypothetical protein [Tanacetum cinerariifolium]
MRRNGKGFSRVDTPLFVGMLVQQQVQAVEDVAEDEDDDNEVSTEPTPPSPTPATPPPSPTQEHIPSPPQAQTAQTSSPSPQQPSQTLTLLWMIRRIHPNMEGITKLDDDEDVTLVGVEEDINADIQGRLAESQEKVHHLDLQHAKKVLSMQDTDEAEPAEVEKMIEVVTAAKLMTAVVTTAATTITATQVPKASASKKRRGVVIQDYEEIATASLIVQIEDDVMKQVKRREKQDNTDMRYQALKRKPITKAQTRKNMMIYLKNMARFKMDFFKGMTYNEIRLIFEKHYNSIRAFLEKGEDEVIVPNEGSKRKGEHLKQDTTKKYSIDEDEEELKTHLQIIANDDDDVEDLEALWKLVKERFESTEPKNFSDDFFLNTLKIMYEKPNVEASVWRDQKGIYGLVKVKSLKLFESYGVHIITLTTTQMILLVEKKYPLTHFTLEQMLNNVRLKVEEESEMHWSC